MAVQARNYYSLGTLRDQVAFRKIFLPPKGTYWRVSKTTFKELNDDGRVWWGKGGESIPRIKKYLSEAKQGVVPATLWFHEECGTNAEAKTEIRTLFEDQTDTEMFITPKPERLLKRVLEVATNPVTGYSTPLPVPERPGRWRTRWGGGGSWSSWVNTATRTSSRG